MEEIEFIKGAGCQNIESFISTLVFKIHHEDLLRNAFCTEATNVKCYRDFVYLPKVLSISLQYLLKLLGNTKNKWAEIDMAGSCFIL